MNERFSIALWTAVLVLNAASCVSGLIENRLNGLTLLSAFFVGVTTVILSAWIWGKE